MLTDVVVYIVLVLLTALTFGLSFAGLGGWSMLSALTIALAKSTLVVIFFMHITEHGRSSRLAFLAGLSLALILIGFSMLDVISRVPSLTAATLQVGAGGP